MLRRWKKDPVREHARELLRHARHFRHMREDLLDPTVLAELNRLTQALATVLEGYPARPEAIQAAHDDLHAFLGRHTPRRRFPGLRENLEILVVAIGVAMACRTYLIQPFKIPTGSMQPTLFGIQYEPCASESWLDRYPLKLLKWVVTGSWYLEVRTRESGYVGTTVSMADASNGKLGIAVGRRIYGVPMHSPPRLEPGQYLPKGSVLWRGMRVAGDHVFVDRIRWNFTAPRRGQIMVFNTDGISGLPPKTHYIKRMAGLPGETISIQPPDLLVGGYPVREPEGIARVASMEDGYSGYTLVDRRTEPEPGGFPMLRTPNDSIALSATQYFALGDNTRNSRDSRYWGAVPRDNLVGPAVVVYWPFSRRWGFTR